MNCSCENPCSLQGLCYICNDCLFFPCNPAYNINNGSVLMCSDCEQRTWFCEDCDDIVLYEDSVKCISCERRLCKNQRCCSSCMNVSCSDCIKDLGCSFCNVEILTNKLNYDIISLIQSFVIVPTVKNTRKRIETILKPYNIFHGKKLMTDTREIIFVLYYCYKNSDLYSKKKQITESEFILIEGVVSIISRIRWSFLFSICKCSEKDCCRNCFLLLPEKKKITDYSSYYSSIKKEDLGYFESYKLVQYVLPPLL